VPINERQKPYRTTQQEQNLRWEYGRGNMSLEEFDIQYAELLKQGLIIRDGRVISDN